MPVFTEIYDPLWEARMYEDNKLVVFNSMLYPFTSIDIGLGLWWLYSAWFNVAVALLFASLLMLREEVILKIRTLQDIIRFTLMTLASISFGSAKASEILLGYVNPVLVEGTRFASVERALNIDSLDHGRRP